MRFLGMIAAMGSNGVIGAKNDLLWHLPDDFKYFKETTLNRVVVMGRKTYDSMGFALPHRYNFVLTKNKNLSLADARVFTAEEQAMAHAYKIDATPFIIGGANIYGQFLPKASHLFLTYVDFEEQGEAYFPNFDASEYQVLCQKKHPADARHKYSFEFRILERIGFEATEAEQAFLSQQIESLLSR